MAGEPCAKRIGARPYQMPIGASPGVVVIAEKPGLDLALLTAIFADLSWGWGGLKVLRPPSSLAI
jgi:hypothetical protein